MKSDPAKMTRILDLRNEVEAGLLKAVLEERMIPHVIRSLRDVAYDGLMQAQVGCWGWVEAPEAEKEAIQAIYRDVIEQRDAAETAGRRLLDNRHRKGDHQAAAMTAALVWRGERGTGKNMTFVKIIELKNEIEANLIVSILEERGIPHVVRRSSDPALEGFFSDRAGWGALEAEPGDADLVREICADIRSGAGQADADAE